MYLQLNKLKEDVPLTRSTISRITDFLRKIQKGKLRKIKILYFATCPCRSSSNFITKMENLSQKAR